MQDPKTEKGFKYICYKKGGFENNEITLPFDNGIFLVHPCTGKIDRWDILDDDVDVNWNNGITKASFRKIHDELGFTVWKNTEM